MSTSIKNAKTEFFDSKEHYLKFRQAWKDYINAGHHKCGTYETSGGGTAKYDSELTGLHHLVYNVLRGRDLLKSYAPITNFSRHQHELEYSAFGNHRQELENLIRRQEWQDQRGAGKSQNVFASLQKPFNGTLTDNMIRILGQRLQELNLQDIMQEAIAA